MRKEIPSVATTKVVCEIPGTVCRLEANVGDRLSEDDPIVFVESMKMEIPVGAPVDGKLTEILVNEGDAVTEGQHVATLET